MEAGTRSNAVFDRLRGDLLAGHLEPGTKLKLAVLSERYGMSLSVVREALSRLAEQGLVVAHPQRGFSVVALSADDLADLTATRIDVETLAARRAADNGGLAWETALVAAHHTLARTPVVDADGEINQAWQDAHQAFHRALIAGCGSPRLQRIASALRDAAELYRVWSRSLAGDEGRDVAAEHRQLTELALAHDGDGLAVALAEHIQRTTDVLLRYATTADPASG